MLEVKEITEEEFETMRRQLDVYYLTVGFLYNPSNDNLVAFRHVMEGVERYYKIVEN